jgi:glycosyltransferase involved in cell wall biosynthesis
MMEKISGRLYLSFQPDRNELGGGNRADLVCADILRARFDVVDSPLSADLQVRSASWDAPSRSRRLYIDHGSFADASFWAYVAPRLMTTDTILVSSSVCVCVAERCFAEDRPLIVNVPFSVDTEVFRPAEGREALRREMEEEFNIPQDGPLLLVVAAYVRRKNHHLAIHFFRALLEEAPAARLLLVGSVPDAAVEELARANGVSRRVRFLESMSQARLARIMAGSDLLLHLTNCRLENFGLVVAEALASGLPVVGADWGGLRDLVEPGRTGLLTRTYLSDLGPRTDWRSAVRPAAALLRDRQEWRAMSRRARRWAEENLSKERYEERLCSAVRRALERGRGRDGSVTLSPAAIELMFRTVALNATHPEIRDVGDEYRLLMPLDGGAHYRFLSGPAATCETPPRVVAGDRLYALAPWSEEGGKILLGDPAWPGSLAPDPLQLAILRASDGMRTLDAVCDRLGIAASARPEAQQRAQTLIDQGVLCPVA